MHARHSHAVCPQSVLSDCLVVFGEIALTGVDFHKPSE